MAIIQGNSQQAEVQGLGTALSAKVNFSGALMEMLSTVYVYILMSSIREAIQNACDASRRAGLTFAEGVTVILPTKSNPMITVVDRGAGMTKEFMESDEGYLSFGSSTKNGDDGAAGGLGVGRWAAYGYGRECFISTTHASDMVQRTYFQFQGADSQPKVQPATETEGKVVGTKVFFPVKEGDLDEALRAVSWLKAVMQLTMGDSFSVDAPGALPKVFPAASGVVLDLGEEDSSLMGVKVYPMTHSNLKYSREGLQKGSLIVLTNKDAGVGGLPFHVQSSTAASVFDRGMVVEIPLSFHVPFLPSREEIKYEDRITALMRLIDVAAEKALLRLSEELFDEKSLSSKGALTKLFGASGDAHWFQAAARTELGLAKRLLPCIGGRRWDGMLKVPAVAQMRDPDLLVKYIGTSGTMQPAFSEGGRIVVSDGKERTKEIQFSTDAPIHLVVNDLKSGGVARFRNWEVAGTFLMVSHKSDPDQAAAAVKAINDIFGAQLNVTLTSSLAAFKRTVVGSAVVTTRVATTKGLTYYCAVEKKQVTQSIAVSDFDRAEPKRVWVGKSGGQLSGFLSSVQLRDLLQYGVGLEAVLPAGGVDKLYLLEPKQAAELDDLVAGLKKDGVWAMSPDEVLDLPDGALLLETRNAAASWIPLEALLSDVLASVAVQNVATNRMMQKVKNNAIMTNFVRGLARAPRMELTGTSFDKAIAPHLDLLTGKVRLHAEADVDHKIHALCRSLALFGRSMDVVFDDPKDRQELCEALKAMETAGHINYDEVVVELGAKFPLLKTLKNTVFGDDESAALSQALALLYR